MRRSLELDQIAGVRADVASRYWDIACPSHATWLLIAVCTVSFTLLAFRMHLGLSPDGDRVFGYMADKIAAGEAPATHVRGRWDDGLSFWRASGFRAIGTQVNPRVMLFALFVVWVPIFWDVAKKLASPIAASVITLLAVIWSVPLYPYPLTSWYSLYFATFGVAALLRYTDTHLARWIFLAGVVAGLSFLVDASGIYFLAAALLFLLFDEQSIQDEVQYRDRSVPDSVFSVIVTLGLVGFDVLALRLIQGHEHATELYHFAAPSIVLSFLLMVREWREPRFSLPVRLWQLGGRLLPLFLGALIPVGVVLVPYINSGGAGRWLLGLFGPADEPMQSAFYAAIHPFAAICCLPLFGVLLLNAQLRTRTSRRTNVIAISAMLVWVLVLALRHPVFARWTWASVATSIPLITAVGAIVLLHGSVKGKDATRLMLLLTVAAMCSLVQFPLSRPFYFCLVAPLVILAITGLAKTARTVWSLSLLAPVAVFYAVFALTVILPTQAYGPGWSIDSPLPPLLHPSHEAVLCSAAVPVEMFEEAGTIAARYVGILSANSTARNR